MQPLMSTRNVANLETTKHLLALIVDRKLYMLRAGVFITTTWYSQMNVYQKIQSIFQSTTMDHLEQHTYYS